MNDYVLYFVFAGIIFIALVIYWLIEFIVAKKIKLKAIQELDRQITEEESAKNASNNLQEQPKEEIVAEIKQENQVMAENKEEIK